MGIFSVLCLIRLGYVGICSALFLIRLEQPVFSRDCSDQEAVNVVVRRVELGFKFAAHFVCDIVR